MNRDVRKAIRVAGVRHWQIAKQIGISEFTLVRWLREELPEARKQAIYEAIEALQREEG